ncbi:Uncharacterised protein [Weissella viridescens]|uniref:Uncharacterized protein n=1 Tax=Weissella viridescens TaxID=1629 RepID=A0A380P7S9_WEIVI|nr:Uncharacterised protein [Weissella viridescens]
MRIASDVSTWVSEVVTSPVKAVGNTYNAMTQMFDVYEENERLNKRLINLQQHRFSYKMNNMKTKL